MVTESVEITLHPDGNSPTGSRVEVHLKGDHEFANPATESTIAYMMTCAIFHLVKTGVVAKTMADLYKVEISGSMKLESE